ncbi:hypothetical protein DY000_02040938 [Brassica cretica]|uniref:Aspartic peptidase DDI1-type domain-containing protein n=1 Tax=Brassica cretica TaxID=69181 RepID=A0ABQ7B4E6_BRACR|nr:hypothetical protein DY000_02040938 [Brassica cretica]
MPRIDVARLNALRPKPNYWGKIFRYRIPPDPKQNTGLWVPATRHPDPRYDVFRIRSQGPPPSSGKRKTSDKENLPYFRIWKSLTCSNRLRPTLRRLYKDNLPETIMTPSDDAADPMEVDRVSMGGTLRKRKEKVAKHLKRGANEKERESFQKRVFRIPLEKPFEEVYFTHRLWMFLRETRETEEEIRRMFCEARENMKKMITLKKKSVPGQFAIPCTVEPSKELFTFVDCSQRSLGGIATDLEVQIGNALISVDFHVLDIKLNWNSSLLLGSAFLSTVGAVCNLQTNQLCLTLIDPHVHYNPIPVKKPYTSNGSINDPGLIAACHCRAEYETKYSASIETHTTTSIDRAHQKSTNTPKNETVDSSP